MIIWFEFQDDEIAAVIMPESSIGILVAEAVGILFDRGIPITPSQVVLRFEGQILDRMASVSDYGIMSEDTVEIHVLPPSGRKSSQDRRSFSPTVAPRDIFQTEDERGMKDQESSSAPAQIMGHPEESHQFSSSPPVS